jgi:DNA/RNA endonuclease G (NUC1)
VTRAESLRDADGSEARESWYEDPRLLPDRCGDDRLYVDQRVAPGSDRSHRMFHRGHLVRRLDPCWGSKSAALRAEADTFHFTDGAPQVGKSDSGQTLWQGLENHVLDNARLHDERVCDSRVAAASAAARRYAGRKRSAPAPRAATSGSAAIAASFCRTISMPTLSA